jgi:hypothetical protein
MNAVADSETAMNAVADSEIAMEAVANSETAMEAVANSETAMNAVAPSAIALNAICKTSIARSAFIDSRYRDTYYDTILTTLTDGTDYFTCVKNNATLWDTYSSDKYYYNSTYQAGTKEQSADACFAMLKNVNNYSSSYLAKVVALENSRVIISPRISDNTKKVVPGGMYAYCIGDNSRYYLFKAV